MRHPDEVTRNAVSVTGKAQDEKKGDVLAARRVAVPDKTSNAERVDACAVFPSGWFVLCQSNEIAVGEVRALRYFGRDLVVWRGEDGRARMLDARCPHARVDMANGGTVQGNWLQCPAHWWQWDESGALQAIPYSQRPIRQADQPCGPKWPLSEIGGMLFVWHHVDRSDPTPDRPIVGGKDTSMPTHEWMMAATACSMRDLLADGLPIDDLQNMMMLTGAEPGRFRFRSRQVPMFEVVLYWTPVEHDRLHLRLGLDFTEETASVDANVIACGIIRNLVVHVDGLKSAIDSRNSKGSP